MSNRRHFYLGEWLSGAVDATFSTMNGKPKEGQYHLISAEEGRVGIMGQSGSHFEPRDDETAEDLPGTTTLDSQKKKLSVSSCCGIKYLFIWKAIGITLAVAVVWNVIALLRWALKEVPSGLELMPEFGTSLGCLDAPFIYNQSTTTFHAQIGSQYREHTFDILGSAVGTFTILQESSDTDDVKYELTLRSTSLEMLEDVHIQLPEAENGKILTSRLLISTPGFKPSASSCMRYDIKIFIPSQLKKLHLTSHATAHVQFNLSSDIVLDDLYVTLFDMSIKNMILPSTHVRANRISLEVIRGWIVGDVAVEDTTTVITQRGDGITNVRVHPMEPQNPGSTLPMSFRTITGAGRTDVFYMSSKRVKRPIRNTHLSSRNADLYLMYHDAEFNGRVELASSKYTVSGLEKFLEPEHRTQDEQRSRWTHWRGDKDGGDEMVIKSKGWTGLFF